MDKKNAMLLTTIAVATLLVAVIGASFAYFVVTSPTTKPSTTVTAASQALPTITLTQKDQSLSINLTNAQMVEGANNVSYWAQSGTGQAAATKRSDVVIANITTANGVAGNNYACDVTVTVTPTDANSALTGFGSGNVKLYLGGGFGLKTTEAPTTGIVISDTTKKTITGTLNLVGTGSNINLTAALEVINSKTVNQSAAAGKTITVKIDTSVTNCHYVAA